MSLFVYVIDLHLIMLIPSGYLLLCFTWWWFPAHIAHDLVLYLGSMLYIPLSY